MMTVELRDRPEAQLTENVHLTLPASSVEIQSACAKLSKPFSPDTVIETAITPLPALDQALKGMSATQQDIYSLDYLCRRLDYLVDAERELLNGAIALERPLDIETLCNISLNLDKYMRMAAVDAMELPLDTPMHQVSPSVFIIRRDELEPLYSHSYLRPEICYEKDALFFCNLCEADTDKLVKIAIPFTQERYMRVAGNIDPRKLVVRNVRDAPGVDLVNYLPIPSTLPNPQHDLYHLNELAGEICRWGNTAHTKLQGVLLAELPSDLESASAIAANIKEYDVVLDGSASFADYGRYYAESENLHYDGALHTYIDFEQFGLDSTYGIVKTEKGFVSCTNHDLLLPQEETTILYSPLRVMVVDEGLEHELDPALAAEHQSKIVRLVMEFIIGENPDITSSEPFPYLAERLPNHLLKQKIVSIEPGAEFMNGKVWGYTSIVSNGPLGPYERQVLEDYLTDHYLNNEEWDHALKREEMKIGDLPAYVSFNTRDIAFYTEQELPEIPAQEQTDVQELGGW